ncbi:hypothetical protein MAPG_00096 [Magnaporthiopsis poae ATCC 64411]|uniref:Heterokaryon incompatibility domain-containing protein n=1 Tax=Magnaporthiopsis poae (strain ATCC 64411 / 73-15) TaxID=644358 RepID=A0A0C4DK34_MAGP6|nr:hypothetical protein MAPG_00096 [Magnaporthiopsis poae ATCC 64411]
MHPSSTPPISPISKIEEDDGASDCPFCDHVDERCLRQRPVTACCTKCAGMTGTADGLRRLLDPQGFVHSTRHELDESAFAGCPVCRVILDNYVGFYSAQGCDDKIILKGAFTNPSGARGFAEHSSHPLEGMVLEGIQAYRQTKREASSARDGKALFFEGALVASDPACGLMAARLGCSLTEETVTAIRQGLEECQEEHGSCPKRGCRPLPVRVIDISSASGVRLRETAPGETGQYATLSYCWGAATQLTTNTANLQSHLRSIDPSSLSKTISDAIQVCRSIGMPYLWVDALCIVQDDETDKRNQIRDMGRIYKLATFSIVAASAEKAADGFLSSRLNDDSPPSWSDCTKISVLVGSGKTTTAWLVNTWDYQLQITANRVFSRGWTFQEWLLSPRAVVFDSCQVSLYCATKNSRPAGFLAMPASQDRKYDALQIPASIFGGVDKCPPGSGGRFAAAQCDHSIAEHQDRTWIELVGNYSKRDFSRFSDRQPALEGIVAELAAVWDDKYLAGLWERTIMKHLVWSAALGPTPQDLKYYDQLRQERTFGSWERKRPEGPTWSWITSPDAVSLATSMGVVDARLVSCDIQLASPMSPFGHVRSGILTINAIVLDVSRLEILCGLVAENMRKTTADRSHRGEWDFRSFYMQLDGYYVDHKPSARDCKLAYIGRSRPDSVDDRHNFLIVEPVGTGRYRRIGRSIFGTSKTVRAASPHELAFIASLETAKREDIIIE